MALLLAHRGIEVPELQATVCDHAALHSRYRAILQVRSGVVVDDDLLRDTFERRLDPGRSNLIVALSGTTRVRTGGPGGRSHWLAPGEFLTERRDRGWSIRQDREVFILEWEPGPLGAGPAYVEAGGSLSPAGLADLRRAALTLAERQATPETVGQALTRIIDILRAAGAPLESVHPAQLIEPVSAAARALNAAADGVIRSLSDNPMNIDLEHRLGWSERHIRRRLREYHRHYGYNASGGLRDLVRRWRAVAGTALMTARGATTAGVAARLGYATPSALCNTFAELGLPSPGSLVWELARLE